MASLRAGKPKMSRIFASRAGSVENVNSGLPPEDQVTYLTRALGVRAGSKTVVGATGIEPVTPRL